MRLRWKKTSVRASEMLQQQQQKISDGDERTTRLCIIYLEW